MHINFWILGCSSYHKFPSCRRLIKGKKTSPPITLEEEDEDVAEEHLRVSSGAASSDVLQLNQLSKVYQHLKKKVHAVKRLSVGIPAGEVSVKTMLLKINKPKEGVVTHCFRKQLTFVHVYKWFELTRDKCLLLVLRPAGSEWSRKNHHLQDADWRCQPVWWLSTDQRLGWVRLHNFLFEFYVFSCQSVSVEVQAFSQMPFSMIWFCFFPP